MRVISFVNLKGGVGKTLSTINTAAILAKVHEKNVLVIDADSQCNMTEFFKRDDLIGKCYTLADALRAAPDAGETARNAIYATSFEGVDIIQADDSLMGLDLTSAVHLYTDCLADLVRRLKLRKADYDFVLIDCPPAFNAASTAALLASDEVIIPIKLDAFSLRGMSNLTRQIENMREINPGLRLGGLLPTMYYKSDKIQDAMKLLRYSGLPIYPRIRRTPKADDSTFAGRPLIETSPTCAAAKDYRHFVDELLKGGEQNG